jgi:8-oxo-dGTP diphosphatase
MDKRPRVGVGVIVIKDGKVLLGERKGSHGEGAWQFPGGHLEYGEAIEDCARREVEEETGLQIKYLRYGPFTNDLFAAEDKHYVTLYVLADYLSGIPEVREPEKCREWGWYDWHQLPEPLFVPIKNLLKQGFQPPGGERR